MEPDEDVSDVDGKTQPVEHPPVLPYQTHMWFQLKTFLTSILLLIALCFGASSKQAWHETWIDIGAIVVEVGPGVVAAIRRGEVLGKLDFSKPLAKTQAPSVNYASPGGVATNRTQLINNLQAGGTKITPENVVDIQRLPDGRTVFLETGNSSAGLQHINRHAGEFTQKGISQDQIPDAIFSALQQNKVVGHQSSGTGRPIYEYTFNGQTHRIAITVGDNGFIVGANPTSLP